MNSIYFKIKNIEDEDTGRVLEYFFKDWIDRACENEVKVSKHSYPDPTRFETLHYFQAQFYNVEDVTALKLRGIPEEFQKYLEIL